MKEKEEEIKAKRRSFFEEGMRLDQEAKERYTHMAHTLAQHSTCTCTCSGCGQCSEHLIYDTNHKTYTFVMYMYCTMCYGNADQ